VGKLELHWRRQQVTLVRSVRTPFTKDIQNLFGPRKVIDEVEEGLGNRE